MKNEIEKLKKEITELKKERDDYLDGWKRQKADFINHQKESDKKIEQILKFANEEIIFEMLSVLDSFDMAIESLSKIEGEEDSKKDDIIKGIKMIKSQFENVLRQKGLEEIEAEEGSDFNPEIHEAMAGSGDIVEREIQKGYKLNGKIIRPSRVEVREK